MPIAELNNLDGVIVIDSNLRQDHPLFAQRLRQPPKRVHALCYSIAMVRSIIPSGSSHDSGSKPSMRRH